MNFFNRHILLKVLSLNALGVLVQFVLGIFSVRIVSEFLGANGMALTGNFRSFTSLFKSISVLGLKEGLIKLFIQHSDNEEEKNRIVTTFMGFFFVLSILLALIIFILAKPFSAYLFQTANYSLYLNYFALLLPFFVLQTVMITLCNAEHAFKKIVSIQIITNGVLFLSSFYFIYQQKLEGAFFAIAVADFISFVVALFFFRNTISFGFFWHLKYLKTISKFILMALISAVVIPVTAILIRNYIIEHSDLFHAGIWEATTRISSFYMMFFSAGLSLYYLPKLSALQTQAEFKKELSYYFKTLVPIFLGVLFLVFLLKDLIIAYALTDEFKPVGALLFWQLLGDLFRIMTLAFGFQILVKTMITQYVIVELFFNGCYLLLSYLWFDTHQIEGVLQAYAAANAVTFLIVLFMFRKTILRPTR